MMRLVGWLSVTVVAIATSCASGADPPLPAAPDPPPDPNSLAERLTPTFQLRGRIEADAVMPAQSAASKAQLGDFQNGFGFRRARLGAEGKVGTSSRWIAEWDFARGEVLFRDVFVGLTALPGVREVRVGHFREPFSLEGATSSRFITFMERSPLNQLDPTRNWGVAGYWWPENERMTFAIGAFRTGTDNSGLSISDAPNWSVTSRVTGLPVYEDGEVFRLVHLGAAFSQRHPPDGVVRYEPSPQSNLIDVSDNPASPFLPAVDVLSNSQQLYNLQAAAVSGPLSVQGEWFGTTIQQRGAGMVFLHGFYAYTSYFLTGEHRGYDRTRAGFGQVHVLHPLVRTTETPASGCGAVELAARFTLANFSSDNLPPSNLPNVGAPLGTILYQATLGVNWYLNDYTRLMANYTLAIPAARGLPVLPVHLFGIRTAIWW